MKKIHQNNRARKAEMPGNRWINFKVLLSIHHLYTPLPNFQTDEHFDGTSQDQVTVTEHISG